jgi:IMP cyclohydrolase
MIYIDGRIIASNGQQTDLMYSELSIAKGKQSISAEEIIKNSFKNKFIKYSESGPGIDLTSYEPDSISTPRIAAVVDNSQVAFWIAKKVNDKKKDLRRKYDAQAGISSMITTYKGANESPNVLSFDSDPIPVNMPFNDAKTITDVVFDAMGDGNNDANFRVSVATILKKQNSFEYDINNRF